MKIKLEITTKEQAQDLIKQLSKFVEKEPVKNFKELNTVKGWFVDVIGSIEESSSLNTECDESKTVHATEKQALSSLAAAQLSQLMKDVNGDWVADWRGRATKYIIYAWLNTVSFNTTCYGYNFLSFPTEEIRDTFLTNHKELIEQYFEL